MKSPQKRSSKKILKILIVSFILIFVIFSVIFFFISAAQKNKQEGILTLAFDDGLKSQYEIAFKEMQKYGFNGTLFIIANQTGLFEGRELMSFDNAREMQEAGWEIGSHGMTHDFINSTNMEHQIIASKKVLFLENFSVVSFCCPYGCNESLQEIRELSNKEYQTTISLDWGENNLSSMNSKKLKSKWVNNILTTKEICNWIKKANKNHEWLILRFHGIEKSKKPFHKYDVSSENFKNILKCAKKTNIKVRTIKEVINNE